MYLCCVCRWSAGVLHIQPWFCHLLVCSVLLSSLCGDVAGLCAHLHLSQEKKEKDNIQASQQRSSARIHTANCSKSNTRVHTEGELGALGVIMDLNYFITVLCTYSRAENVTQSRLIFKIFLIITTNNNVLLRYCNIPMFIKGQASHHNISIFSHSKCQKNINT